MRCSPNGYIFKEGDPLAQLIRPQEVKIVTKQGECEVSIVLELNINLNSDGLQVSALAKKEEPTPVSKSQVDDVQWAIPDFGPSEKINFGKNIS